MSELLEAQRPLLGVSRLKDVRGREGVQQLGRSMSELLEAQKPGLGASDKEMYMGGRGSIARAKRACIIGSAEALCWAPA